MRIVVVDDDPVVLRAMRRILTGHDVALVETGRDAIHHMRAGADLLICDMKLPGMSGGDLLLEKLCYYNGRMRRIPTIVVSGYVAGSDTDEDAGPIVVLPKPIDGAKILRTIARLCPTTT